MTTHDPKTDSAFQGVTDEERERIEQAVPAQAPAQPAKARKLLVFDRTVGTSGHGCIPYINLAFTRMGEKTDMNQGRQLPGCKREDGDYPVAWVRGEGKGRVFYCSIGHDPCLFWDPKILEFYLAATQFVLGDLPGATAPRAMA
jgi:hypothetical protein